MSKNKSKYASRYYRDRRDRLISLLGGQCARCSTTENLEFDHIDPKSKSFVVSKVLSYSWEVILQELDKCQLLCKSCHKHKTVKEDKPAAKGENHYKNKLTENDVRSIMDLLRQGGVVSQIARDFGVARTTINGIKFGKNWKHIAEP